MNKIIFVLSLIWLSVACRKITPNETHVPPCPSTDYRAQFLGDYECIVYGTFWDMDQGNSWDTSKTVFHITKGNQANTIIIQGLLPFHSFIAPSDTIITYRWEYIIDSTGKMNLLGAQISNQGNIQGKGSFISSECFDVNAAYYWHPHSGIRTIHGKRK